MLTEISIIALGLRGFPNVQGGVETHAENLYFELARIGCEIQVLVRSGYQPVDNRDMWNNIRFTRLWAPRFKSAEAILHTFFGVIYAGFKRPDVLHIHGIGPALMTPLARAFGLKVVVTHHGPDYERQKWGRMARCILRLGESLGMHFSHERIVISNVIRNLVAEKHARQSVLIPNGVRLPQSPTSSSALQAFGLIKGKYVLLVSRLVPEKRHLDLIDAFSKANLDGWKLAIVGASDHPDAYVKEVLAAAARTANVVCTGFQTGLALRELYAHAGMFVLPSSHEGLPLAMLEALSFGVPAIASDIAPNLEVLNPGVCFYRLGDVEDLARRLRKQSAVQRTAVQAGHVRQHLADTYCWEAIARDTRKVYERATGQGAVGNLHDPAFVALPK